CTFVWAWMRRPGSYAALAAWDSNTNRREAFAAAWWFGKQSTQTEHASRHIELQRPLLAEALPQLKRDLPLSFPQRTIWIAALVCVLFGLSQWRIATTPADLVDGDLQERAATGAGKLAEGDWAKKDLAGLTDEEKKELENLRQKVEDTAEDLKKNDGQTARDVLAAMEQRARDAEKLASKLGASGSAWASKAMVDELRGHADTADLGDAVADRDAKQVAAASSALAEQLRDPKLSDEAKNRMKNVLSDAELKAEKEDRERIVGQPVLSASDAMEKSDVPAAAAQFQSLAEQMKDMAQREEMQKKLEALAQQLRDAAGKSGEDEGGGMQQMAGAQQQGQSGAGQEGEVPDVGQNDPNQSAQQMMQQQGAGQQQLAPPGLQNPGQSQPQMSQSGAQGNQSFQPGKPGDGQQPKDGSQPMLMAPVPKDQQKDAKPDGIVMGPPQEGPQSGKSILVPTGGGKKAGAGKAKLDSDATTANKTGKQSMVNAQSGNDGQSSSRSVDGVMRDEQATRTATQTSVDFIDAEEAALDDAALPPARREQVRRYFNELRKRFEGNH
ncbi:MAG: hypothetical protein KDK97_13815, partial [Verrucomicrobiales bacterium]|nr:hypothetical protein [Verrucomicrobiales bacterium]